MRNGLNYSPSYEIGKEVKKQSKRENLKFSSSYNKDKVFQQYISHIEGLINLGKIDKARELVIRNDRFPDNYSNYLRKYSLEDFKNIFPNLRKSKFKRNFDDLMIK
ncbi:MAG: hypothetical protein ACW981_09210 [Candidatus Hodarchaeales archaeon]|jgi:hypothetical protein